MSIYDLRKHNIKTEQDALEFLQLVEARIPQITKVLKRNKLKEASLTNKLRAEKSKNYELAAPSVAEGASVLDQLTGKAITENKEVSRIEQLRQVADPSEKVKEAAKELRETGRIKLPETNEAANIKDITLEEVNPSEPIEAPAPEVKVDKKEDGPKNTTVSEVLVKAQEKEKKSQKKDK